MGQTRWAATSLLTALALATGGWGATQQQQQQPATTAAPAAQNGATQSIFNDKPFSADMVVLMGPDKTEGMHGKIYAGGENMRIEMTNPAQAGMQSVVIVRQDKKVAWMLMPAQERYMEMPLRNGGGGPLAALRDKTAKIDVQDQGADKVGDYDCEKYHFHTTREGQDMAGTAWVASSGAAKGFLVRVAMENQTAVTEFRNIQPGEPAATLFEVPAGYQKMDMPSMPQAPHE